MTHSIVRKNSDENVEMDDDDNEEAREDRDGRNKSRAGVANIGEKISDAGLRWLGCENK